MKEKKALFFVKELFFNLKLQPRFIILWLAGFLFIILVTHRIYR
ncbi:Uncharacterised protein [Yersinia rohdei]|uniref:Uncharacterized protein n=1 Tax=Yersinia rohdei TaxID=29485 RepID=A0A0U1HQM4_YERRO|nr:Uncharacterised protein [Yersinia rohdei]CQI88860.1 Uncharacterised protein [Yersinia rohdei]CQJ56616.1 Uncharacterised protein [Yersinia rohdei]